MARAKKDRSKILDDRKAAFLSDLECLSNAEVATPRDVADMILDKDIDVKPHALGYFLRAIKVPHSYFISASDNHKVEIFNHALVSVKTDVRLAVARKDSDVVSVGPVEAIEPFKSFKSYIKSYGGVVGDLVGSLINEGWVRLFVSLSDLPVGRGYKQGLIMMISPLFCRYFSVGPLVYEVVCTNGLVHEVDVKTMVMTSSKVSQQALDDGRAAALAVYESRRDANGQFLDALSHMRPIPPAEIDLGLKLNMFPKGYRDKVVPLLEAVTQHKEGHVISDDLPAQIVSALDTLSVLTYQAREFNVSTRYRIERELMTYAATWLPQG